MNTQAQQTPTSPARADVLAAMRVYRKAQAARFGTSPHTPAYEPTRQGLRQAAEALRAMGALDAKNHLIIKLTDAERAELRAVYHAEKQRLQTENAENSTNNASVPLAVLSPLDEAQKPVSRDKCAVDRRNNHTDNKQHGANDHGDDSAEAIITRMPGKLVPFPAINHLSIGVINPFTQSDKKTTCGKQGQCTVRDYQHGYGNRDKKEQDTQRHQHVIPVLRHQIEKVFDQFFHGRRAFWMKGIVCGSLHLAFKHAALPPILSCKRLDIARIIAGLTCALFAHAQNGKQPDLNTYPPVQSYGIYVLLSFAVASMQRARQSEKNYTRCINPQAKIASGKVNDPYAQPSMLVIA